MIKLIQHSNFVLQTLKLLYRRSFIILWIDISLFNYDFDCSCDICPPMLANPYFSICTRTQHLPNLVIICHFAAILQMITEKVRLFMNNSTVSVVQRCSIIKEYPCNHFSFFGVKSISYKMFYFSDPEITCPYCYFN